VINCVCPKIYAAVKFVVIFVHTCNFISSWDILCEKWQLQHTDQEMIPARNARNVVTLAEVMFLTIQRENILPSKITDYYNAHELLTTE
jgi:hypothetical protein